MRELLLLFAVIVGTALPLLILWGLFQGLTDEWSRFGPGKRRRGIVAGAIVAVAIVVGIVVLILLDPAQR
jgi:hypothetical protein